MSIQDRNLKPGTVLVKRYKKQDHRCEVVAGEKGKVLYRLGDGREFTSPSAAGSAVMGGVACNGWAFWSVEGQEPPAKARTAPKKAAPKPKPASKPKGRAKAKGGAKPKRTGSRKVKGGSNGRTPEAEPSEPVPEKPVSCGECGQEFPTSRDAAAHMQEEHGSAEAAGSGGR